MNSRKRDSGQIALILVLVMTVIASAAVALAGRTTVETRLQEVNVDSSQAQIAAESGLEQALKNSPNAPTSGTLDSTNGSVSYSVGNNVVSANETVYKGIRKGETVDIVLRGPNGNVTGNPSNITILWSPVGTDPTPRAIYVTKVDPTKITDYAFDTVGGTGTGFALAGAGSFGFTYSGVVPLTVVPVTNLTTELKVTALGGDIDIGFRPDVGTLAPQLVDRPVVGTVARGTEKVQYAIDYRQSVNTEVPEIFDYAMFSGTKIEQ
jgi:hypothetical protein